MIKLTYISAKHLEQSKYQHLLKTFERISSENSYPIIEASYDKIIPITRLPDNNQKLVIFDDYICENNQQPLINYFIQGRQKNWSVKSEFL